MAKFKQVRSKFKDVKESIEAVHKAAMGAGEVSEEDWQRYINFRHQANLPGVDPQEKEVELNALNAWKQRLSQLDKSTVQRYQENRRVRYAMRKMIRQEQGEVRTAHAQNVKPILPGGFPAGLILKDQECEPRGELKQRVTARDSNGNLVTDPDFQGGTLVHERKKSWEMGSEIFVIEPAVVCTLKGTFSVDVPVSNSVDIFRATSRLSMPDIHVVQGGEVSRGKVQVRSTLKVTGPPVDPLSLTSAGGTDSQLVAAHHFGSDATFWMEGFDILPTQPLNIDVDIVGAGTITVKEIIQYQLTLEDYKRGGYAWVHVMWGEFRLLCWETVQLPI